MKGPRLFLGAFLWGSSLQPALASTGDERIVVGLGLVLGAGLGLWAFLAGFKAFKRKRLIEDTPTSTIRAMAPGQVEILGKGVDWRPLTAPFSRTASVYYEVQVEEERTRQVKTKNGYRTEHYWATLYSEETSEKPFYMDDGTGLLRVLPKGAERLMGDSFRIQPGLFQDIPPHVVDYLKTKGVDCFGLFGFKRPLRFTERSFAVGEPLYALGNCQRAETLKDAPLGALPDQCLAKGPEGEIYILSDRSQKEITSSLGWQAFFGIFGGILLWAGAAYLWTRFGRTLFLGQ